MLLLCGGTGALGREVAARLAARGAPTRALVRPGTDASSLRLLGAEVVVGDLRDPASLDRALEGVQTVLSTATALTRLLDGAKRLSLASVDRDGNANLVAAAEGAGVERFVFMSVAGLTEDMARRAPLAAAKRHTEELLRASAMRPVILRSDKFQELWCSSATGIDAARGRATVFGWGRVPETYVALPDVAEVCVRMSEIADPPELAEFGGPEALTRVQVIEAFERAFGRRFHRSHVPRMAMGVGSFLMRRIRPEIASVLGMALEADVNGSTWTSRLLEDLEINARPTSRYIAELATQGAVDD